MAKARLEEICDNLIINTLKYYERKHPDKFVYLNLPPTRKVCTVVTPDGETYELQMTQMRVPYTINSFELTNGNIVNLDDLIQENFRLHLSNLLEVELNKSNMVYAFYAGNLQFDRVMYQMTYRETMYISFNFLLHSI